MLFNKHIKLKYSKYSFLFLFLYSLKRFAFDTNYLYWAGLLAERHIKQISEETYLTTVIHLPSPPLAIR